MTPFTPTRKSRGRGFRPRDPNVKPIEQWLPANQGFYAAFRRWLKEGGYGDSALKLYSTAARIALGWLDTAYWMIDPDADLQRVREYVADRYDSQATRETYLKGLAKLEQYLRFRCHKPKPRKPVNWPHYVGALPRWLADDVRAYLAHRRRAWPPEEQRRLTITTLSHLTLFLRWAAERAALADAAALTPDLWFDYLDERLAAGRSPITVNVELKELHVFLLFLGEQGRPICRRTLQVEPVGQGTQLPKDVPLDQLRRLFDEIEVEAGSEHPRTRRLGVMDRAWALLMLHCGLRTKEVRHLRLPDLDLDGRRVRVERSKGLKDRVVFLSQAAVDALRAWIDIRGPASSDCVFLFRHAPLSASYCYARLRTYSRRAGVRVTPHQLRHSMATLLINAGAPVVTVQALLGHKHIDTTLIYVRLYDATVAADYYRAMGQVEARMELQDGAGGPMLNGGQLLALVDSLREGTLNAAQKETVYALREGILALVEQPDAHCGG